MDALFTDWKWGNLKIHNVVNVKTANSPKFIRNCGHTVSYQLGVRFTGSSELRYKGELIDYSAKTAAYLPKEKTADIDYTTVTIEDGNGITIFFDSEYPLPDRPQILKNISPEAEKAALKVLHAYLRQDSYSYPELMASFYDLLSKLYKLNSDSSPEKRNHASSLLLIICTIIVIPNTSTSKSLHPCAA